MSVADKLQGMRARQPGCDLAMFGDLSARLTLCVSADTKLPQEDLDAMIAGAGDLLDGPVSQQIAATLGAPDGSGLNEAVVLGLGRNQLVLRSRRDASDVMACQCGPATDLVALAGDASRVLRQLGES